MDRLNGRSLGSKRRTPRSSCVISNRLRVAESAICSMAHVQAVTARHARVTVRVVYAQDARRERIKAEKQERARRIVELERENGISDGSSSDAAGTADHMNANGR